MSRAATPAYSALLLACLCLAVDVCSWMVGGGSVALIWRGSCRRAPCRPYCTVSGAEHSRRDRENSSW